MTDDPKPKLSDIIGGLVASMVHARTVADMESLRVAYRFRDNDLLRGMPIPRLRLQRVSISLPVLMSDVIPGKPAEAAPPAAIAEGVLAAFTDGLKEALDAALFDLDQLQPGDRRRPPVERSLRLLAYIAGFQPAGWKEALAAFLDAGFRAVGVGDATSPPPDTLIRDTVRRAIQDFSRKVIQDGIVQYARQRVDDENAQAAQASSTTEPVSFDVNRAAQWSAGEVADNPYIQAILHHVTDAGVRLAVVRPSVSPDFHVTVNTEDIKAAGGGPEAVTRVSLSLREEGLEWIQEQDAAGNSSHRLLPE